jgi:aspartokinase
MKVVDAVEAIIKANPSIHFALHHRLLNLTQLSEFIVPAVRARIDRDVTTSAILMALSRIQRDLPKGAKRYRDRFRVDSLHVQSDLFLITVAKSGESIRRIHSIVQKLGKAKSYFTVTEGTSQITLIAEQRYCESIAQEFGDAVEHKHRKASAICVRFSNQYLSTPGFLHHILQQLAMQGINLLEIASTANELVLYLEKGSVELAFRTLYERFMT